MNQSLKIEIAKPCKVPWNEMIGDDRTRHCLKCKKNVYNVENFSASEIRDLLAKPDSPPCLRIYKRSDGTVLTTDCPVGVYEVWKKRGLYAAVCFFIITAIGAKMYRDAVVKSMFEGRETGFTNETVVPQEDQGR
jgi:hypothetical protein